MREVRRAQPAGFMHLAEEHFFRRTLRCLPPPHTPFHGPTLPLPVLVGVFPLQPFHQRLGLQGRLTLQQVLERRPHLDQGIRPRPPCVGRWRFTRQLAPVAILACRLAIHTRFHRRPEQRASPVQVPSYFLHLRIGHLASRSHWTTPFPEKLPV